MKTGETAGVVARELGLVEQTSCNRVKAAANGEWQTERRGSKMLTAEEMAVSPLRAENPPSLKGELEIARKTATY